MQNVDIKSRKVWRSRRLLFRSPTPSLPFPSSSQQAVCLRHSDVTEVCQWLITLLRHIFEVLIKCFLPVWSIGCHMGSLHHYSTTNKPAPGIFTYIFSFSAILVLNTVSGLIAWEDGCLKIPTLLEITCKDLCFHRHTGDLTRWGEIISHYTCTNKL